MIDINNWKWEGVLRSSKNPNRDYNKYVYPKGTVDQALLIIDEMIENADLSECLTSPSEYIRECKKWFVDNEF